MCAQGDRGSEGQLQSSERRSLRPGGEVGENTGEEGGRWGGVLDQVPSLFSVSREKKSCKSPCFAVASSLSLSPFLLSHSRSRRWFAHTLSALKPGLTLKLHNLLLVLFVVGNLSPPALHCKLFLVHLSFFSYLFLAFCIYEPASEYTCQTLLGIRSASNRSDDETLPDMILVQCTCQSDEDWYLWFVFFNSSNNTK